MTSFLAFGLLRLRGVNGWGGWRWLFLIEGLITLTVGIVSFFLMPASAVQTKTWFRPNGWFTEREEAIIVNRVLRDDPSKGDMHNRQAVTPKLLLEALKDYDLWPLYLLGLIIFIPPAPPATYLTLILRKLGFDPFTTNLLTIPKVSCRARVADSWRQKLTRRSQDVFHIILLILLTRLSEYLNERALVSMLQVVWTLPCVIALRWWPGTMTNQWGTYALVTVLTSYPYCRQFTPQR